MIFAESASRGAWHINSAANSRASIILRLAGHQRKKMNSAVIITVIFLCGVVSLLQPTVALSTRNDRIWPIGATANVDLGQSSPFGPRLKISSNSRYDFHRGVDIPTPLFSPVYAVADGIVNIPGSHSEYSDGVVQLKHTDWDENFGGKFYTNYMHTVEPNPVNLVEGQFVTKGQLIGFSYQTSNFPHLHFEVRVGGVFQKHCCNPWKYLPNSGPFQPSLSLTPNYNGDDCSAVVNVSVLPDQLTLMRVELHIANLAEQPLEVRYYDMCEANLDHSFSQMDDPLYQDNPADPTSYQIRISPMFFNSQSYANNEDASYGFEFIDLPPQMGSGKVKAKAIDVFGSEVSTQYAIYTCSP